LDEISAGDSGRLQVFCNGWMLGHLCLPEHGIPQFLVAGRTLVRSDLCFAPDRGTMGRAARKAGLGALYDVLRPINALMRGCRFLFSSPASFVVPTLLMAN
jgi:hypothetical protein